MVKMIKSKINARLDSGLQKKYGLKSFPIVAGDVVSIRKGSRKGEGGKVLEVNHSTGKILIDGITSVKADGKRKEFYVNPSLIEITRMDLSLRGRLDKLKEGAARRHIEVTEEPEPVEGNTEVQEIPSEEVKEPETIEESEAEEKEKEEEAKESDDKQD